MALPSRNVQGPRQEPQVQIIPGLPLPASHTTLLAQAFTDYIGVLVEKRLTSGYSGATVYLVTCDDHAPVVVKIGPRHEMQREYDAYQQLVAEKAPQVTARIQGELLTSADHQLGLLRYAFIGQDITRDTLSFQAYYSAKGAEQASEVLTRLREAIKHWWDNHKLTRRVMSEDYDRLLPVHLGLAISSPAEPTTQVLQAGITDLSVLNDLHPGQTVQFQGFTVTKVQPHSLTLQAERPSHIRSAALRVRLEVDATDGYRIGDTLPTQSAVIKATRQMVLNDLAQQAFPTFAPDKPTFTVEKREYPNPLHQLSERLAMPYDARTAIIHGDLNLQNILVDEATGFAWLIDFAETRFGPILFDLQRLEVQIITKLLAPALQKLGEQARLLNRLLAALHSASLAEAAPLPNVLQAPYTLLVTVRRLAAQYLVKEQEWQEYYQGLVLALIGALKFEDLDEHAHHTALLVAAILSQPLPDELPFKGLLHFEVADAALFFGREALTAELVDYVHSHRLVAVVGASGSGKSSLVRAGVVATLEQAQSGADQSLGRQPWRIYLMTPTEHPLKSLTVNLADHQEADTIALQADLRRDPHSLQRYVDKRLAEQTRLDSTTVRLLLVVDQFEELFTLCHDKGERQAFVENLLTASTDMGVITLVIILRADFYAYCAEFANLRATLESNQKFIGPMTRDELRRAIEEPAYQNYWSFESGLVDLLLNDIGDEPGGLPLLSHALLETWQRRRGRMLTFEGYAAAGRVQGAIAATADRVYKQLNGEQQRIAQNILLRLTELGEGVQDTRRRVGLEELISHAEAKPVVEQVLLTLVNTRLVTTSQEAVEVAHEALIREWPTLREWLQDNREGLRLHRQLTEAANEWEQLKQDSGALYRGIRLARTQQWAEQHVDQLNTREHQFLLASATAEHERQADLQRALEHAQKNFKYEKERRRFLSWVVRGLMIVIIPSLLYFAFWGLRTWIIRTSPWQLVPNFPVDTVTAIAFVPAKDKASPPTYCVSTFDVGVGCSSNGETWNMYQEGLSMGEPASGGIDQFSGSARGVSTIAIDPIQTHTLYAFVYDGYLYKSVNSGIEWQRSGTSLPGENRLIEKMNIYNDQVIAVTISPFANGDNALVTRDSSLIWHLESSEGEQPFVRVYAPHLSRDSKLIYLATETGLYRSPIEWPHRWEKVLDIPSIQLIAGRIEDDRLYIVTFDEKLKKGELWYWDPLDKPTLPQHISSIPGQPKALTIDPNSSGQAYILLTNGEVMKSDEDGSTQSLHGLPWWALLDPWYSPAIDLLAVSRGEKHETWLLEGHYIGLLEYKPSQ